MSDRTIRQERDKLRSGIELLIKTYEGRVKVVETILYKGDQAIKRATRRSNYKTFIFELENLLKD